MEKNYQWEPHQPFILTGQEFSVALNSLRDYFNRQDMPDPIKHIQLYETLKILNAKLDDAVSKGFAKEIITEKPLTSVAET